MPFEAARLPRFGWPLRAMSVRDFATCPCEIVRTIYLCIANWGNILCDEGLMQVLVPSASSIGQRFLITYDLQVRRDAAADLVSTALFSQRSVTHHSLNSVETGFLLSRTTTQVTLDQAGLRQSLIPVPLYNVQIVSYRVYLCMHYMQKDPYMFTN